jgi:hypothetical protein
MRVSRRGVLCFVVISSAPVYSNRDFASEINEKAAGRCVWRPTTDWDVLLAAIRSYSVRSWRRQYVFATRCW